MIKFLVVIIAFCLIEGNRAGYINDQKSDFDDDYKNPDSHEVPKPTEKPNTVTPTTKKPHPSPKCAGKNEEYQIEATGCEPTCSKPNRHIYCKLPCKSACVCKSGYVRDESKGECVKLVECNNFKGCQRNEIWHTCGPIMEGSCDNPRPGVCGGTCRQGCYCYAGYVRNANGTCIKIEDCPKKCGENEIYENCGIGCEPTCNNPKPAVCTNRNEPKCFCKPGWMRLKEGGACVKTCPKQCNDENEIWTCGSACEGTCSVPNPRYCVEKAKEGCFCKPGYVRNSKGKCIDVKTCKNTCTKYEIYMSAPSCEPSCTDPFPARCTGVREGCHCRPGLYRNEQNKCVPYEFCKKRCNGLHEIWWNCAPGCPATCDNPTPQTCTLPTKAGCYCKPGYVRNDQGECIDANECQQRCSDENEIWETQYLNCELTCSNPNPTPQCGGPRRSGCFCKPGYVRNYDGKCILKEKCVPKCVGGKIYQTCGPVRQPTCQDPTPQCSVECVTGCFCPPGYVLDSGNCITRDKCKKECSDGEIKIYCGVACDRTCANPNITSCTSSCTPKCLCGPNKYRSKTGRCVDFEKCESRCGENEEWLQCGPQCRAKCTPTATERTRCNSLVLKHKTKPFGGNCRAGCFCKDGYLLDNNGKCVSKSGCVTNVPKPVSEEADSWLADVSE